METGRELSNHMATKRVILANSSRLLREMLQRLINKADHLEVVQEILNEEELPSAIERFDPEWVILSMPSNRSAPGWIETCMTEYPGVRFILFSPDHSSIKMKWQASYEEDLTNLSLKDFIHILEKDLQHI
jgi:DNA-binding NarL/FixJ family response regulator